MDFFQFVDNFINTDLVSISGNLFGVDPCGSLGIIPIPEPPDNFCINRSFGNRMVFFDYRITLTAFSPRRFFSQEPAQVVSGLLQQRLPQWFDVAVLVSPLHGLFQ